MDWLPLESSLFTSAAYDADRQILHLRFHSREIYRYFEFSPAHYSRIYFSAHIRDRFRCQRLGIAESSQ